jgi:hypothetical protein
MASSSPGTGRTFSAPHGTTAGSPAPAPGVLLFGRYRLQERVSHDGTGVTWNAADETAPRDVAIRLVNPHLLPDERSRSRFAAEARAVGAVTHPGIVAVHDVVTDDRIAAVVTARTEDETLADVIAARGRLPEAAAAAITAQVAHAVQAAHDRGVMHGDLKPANVLLSVDGVARVVAFGVAGALAGREPGGAAPGTIMGARRYLAPEQLADGSADRSSDVFGLGSILYEMLVSRPPFPAATPAAMMAQQRQGAPQILTGSAELAGIARTALQHDPERRPRSAGRMAAFLERWLENREIATMDLAAVTVAALSGAEMPRPEPIVGRRPEITPAPIAERASGPAVRAGGRQTRGKRAGSAAGGTIEGQLALPDPGARPPRGWTSPSAVVRVTGRAVHDDPSPAPASDVVAPLLPVSTPIRSAASRVSSVTPFVLGRRRVPLISAVGLAGLLLAALLLGGALAALQAGSAPASPTAPPALETPSEPAASPAATPAQSPATTAAPTGAPASAVPSPMPLGLPGDQPRRQNH